MSSNDFKNKKIVITRPIERSESLAKIINKYNGIPIVVPTLELQLVKSKELLYISDNIEEFDWLVFTSPAGVKSFFNVFTKDSISSKIAVIGVKTEEVLVNYGYNPDLIPANFTAEGLLESFSSIDLNGKNIALPRTLSARDVLPTGLADYGANVTVAEAYTSSIPSDTSKILSLMDDVFNDNVDIITFTSPLTAHNLFKVIKDEKENQYESFLNKLRTDIIIASIGPITSNALRQYDISAIEASRYTVKDMVETLLQKI